MTIIDTSTYSIDLTTHRSAIDTAAAAVNAGALSLRDAQSIITDALVEQAADDFAAVLSQFTARGDIGAHWEALKAAAEATGAAWGHTLAAVVNVRPAGA